MCELKVYKVQKSWVAGLLFWLVVYAFYVHSVFEKAAPIVQKSEETGISNVLAVEERQKDVSGFSKPSPC